jgi:hypothetical protein
VNAGRGTEVDVGQRVVGQRRGNVREEAGCGAGHVLQSGRRFERLDVERGRGRFHGRERRLEQDGRVARSGHRRQVRERERVVGRGERRRTDRLRVHAEVAERPAAARYGDEVCSERARSRGSGW